MSISLTDGVSYAHVETASNDIKYISFGYIDEEGDCTERLSHFHVGEPSPETEEEVLELILPVVEELTATKGK
jgi:hypothetical protein